MLLLNSAEQGQRHVLLLNSAEQGQKHKWPLALSATTLNVLLLNSAEQGQRHVLLLNSAEQGQKHKWPLALSATMLNVLLLNSAEQGQRHVLLLISAEQGQRHKPSSRLAKNSKQETKVPWSEIYHVSRCSSGKCLQYLKYYTSPKLDSHRPSSCFLPSLLMPANTTAFHPPTMPADPDVVPCHP